MIEIKHNKLYYMRQMPMKMIILAGGDVCIAILKTGMIRYINAMRQAPSQRAPGELLALITSEGLDQKRVGVHLLMKYRLRNLF